MTTVAKHYDGCFRVRTDNESRFGQIKREGREWHAEIRDKQSGQIIRYAGIWSTKRDAVEECCDILGRA